MDYILVPIDFSDCSVNAAKSAVIIANHFNWDVLLLHAITPRFVMGPENAYPLETDDLEADAVNQLEILKNKLDGEMTANKMEAHSINFKVELGFPPDCIKQYSEQAECALIVMGSKGAKGLKRMLLGSMASNVISRVKTPIMLIPETQSKINFKQILYATNFQLYDEIVGNELIALAKLFDASMKILHLSSEKTLEKDSERMDNLKHDLARKSKGVKISYDVQLREGEDLEEAIDQYIEEFEIDLLAIHAHQDTSFLKELIHPNLARKLSLDLKVPLLIFSIK